MFAMKKVSEEQEEKNNICYNILSCRRKFVLFLKAIVDNIPTPLTDKRLSLGEDRTD